MTKILWTFPVPSNCIYNLKFIYDNLNVTIAFDFYDEEDNDNIYNGRIQFNYVVAHRHSSEKFTKFIKGTYDNLCEIIESDWVSELKIISPEWAEYNQIKHYAIYLDSYGLYEFVAKNFEVSEIKRGKLNEELY